jgi:hypothetical protein
MSRSSRCRFRHCQREVDLFRTLEQKHPVPIVVVILAGRGELMRSAIRNRPSNFAVLQLEAEPLPGYGYGLC